MLCVAVFLALAIGFCVVVVAHDRQSFQAWRASHDANEHDGE